MSLEFKQLVQDLYDRLSAPEYSPSSATPTVAVAQMTGPQSSEAKWPAFELKSDEPKSIGGGDTAPTPSSIFVASIGFAENVIFARQAALAGVEFQSLQTKVEAKWDRRGMFGIAESDPSVTDVLIHTVVTTNASPSEIANLVRLNDGRCPMTATVAKAAKVRRALTVNGTEVSV